MLVPAEVATRTSTVPADPAGAVAVMWVASTMLKLAELDPNFTDVAPGNPVPVIVTDVPPLPGPVAGESPDTLGVTAGSLC